MAFKRLH